MTGRESRTAALGRSGRTVVISVLVLVTSVACTGAHVAADGLHSTNRASSSVPTFSTTGAWQENFDGPAGRAADPRLLAPSVSGNGNGNDEAETYTASVRNAALDGHGRLLITARKQTLTGPDGYTRNWTSARLTSLGRWAFTYGSLSARIQGPAGIGLWPAFWLLGADLNTAGYPEAGEIDIFETVNFGTVVYQTIHGPTTSGKPYALAHNTPRSKASATGFHVYGVTRSPGSIEFLIDGRIVSRLIPADLKKGQRWVFDKPMFLLLDLAVGGTFPGPPTASTPHISQMAVDWVRYQP